MSKTVRNKTAVIIPVYKNPTTGGQVYDTYLVKKLEENNCDIDVFTDENLKQKPAISILYNLTLLIQFGVLKKYDTLIINSRLYPRLFLWLKFIRLFNKDLNIHCIHHHFNFSTLDGKSKGIHKWMELSCLKSSTSVLIPSPYTKDVLLKLIPGCSVIYLEAAFDKTQQEIKHITENKLLFVGGIAERKGIHLLIEALGRLKGKLELSLKIVGGVHEEDGYYASLQNKIKKLGLSEHITFTGRVTDDELETLYAESKLFVFPSLHEGYGFVLIEAMKHGLPVIAFHNSALPYTVKHGKNGMLAENKNVKEFADMVESVLNNSEILTKLENGALDTFKNIRSFKDLDEDIAAYAKKLNATAAND